MPGSGLKILHYFIISASPLSHAKGYFHAYFINREKGLAVDITQFCLTPTPLLLILDRIPAFWGWLYPLGNKRKAHVAIVLTISFSPPSLSPHTRFTGHNLV